MTNPQLAPTVTAGEGGGAEGSSRHLRPVRLTVEYDAGTELARISDSQGAFATLKHFSGMTFVFECEARWGARQVKVAPIAPILSGKWPEDDYDGFYAEYYFRRFHQAKAEAEAREKESAEDLLKSLGLED